VIWLNPVYGSPNDDNGYDISDYRDFFHWWPAEKGKPAKRYSFFDVNNDAWVYDSPEYRDLSSKMLTTFLLTMHGTPYYYFTDELSVANSGFDLNRASLFASNYPDGHTGNQLRPYEAVVYKAKQE